MFVIVMSMPPLLPFQGEREGGGGGKGERDLRGERKISLLIK